MLENIDLTQKITKEEYNEKLPLLQEKLLFLQHGLYEKKIPVIILYEGWDAAGKGGNIKRVTEKLNPRGYEVVSIAKPTSEEISHHYLWRFWKRIPERGKITIFDRSWYGRVMVERVEGFAKEEEWKRAYQEINEMESQIIRFGCFLFKFWIQIDKEEQLRRFEERKNDELKSYKLTDEDWRNREKWDQYEKAVDDMLLKTSTVDAPWSIVPGNDKYFARIHTLNLLVDGLKKTVD